LRAVHHQAGGGDVLAQVLTDVLDALAGQLQRDACVEEVLDDLQLDEVAIGVPALGTAALRVGDRRSNEVGAGPVIELAVGDANDLADLRPPETLFGHASASPRPAGSVTGA